MKHWMMCVLVALLAMGSAEAGGRGAVRKQVEMSLLATGTIDVGPDGRVAAYALDQSEKLPPAVRQLMDSASQAWTFEPVVVNGKPVLARTKMSVRFAAKKTGEDAYEVRIAGADFRVATPPEETPSSAAPLKPPSYPQSAARSGVRGTVYVVLRFGRDGRVQDAFAEQVNLRIVDSEGAMEKWRALLASSALATAKQWTFRAPSRGEEAGEDSWSVRVPVDFLWRGESVPAFGQWQAYIPGPRQRAPWIDTDELTLGSDAIADGGVYPVGGGLRLLTPLSGA